jgi:hypothetical protein
MTAKDGHRPKWAIPSRADRDLRRCSTASWRTGGVNTVIVEDASRFARTVLVQEAGIAMLVGLGVRVLTSRGDDLTDSGEVPPRRGSDQANKWR